MKIHTVIVTYDRLELTRRAVASFLETVTVPYTLVLADNGSSDGTKEWIIEAFENRIISGYCALDRNHYPGYACNRGWELVPEDANFLHRSDNDFTFLPGWCERVAERFDEDPLIGQVGLRTDEEEEFASINVGGCNMIRRILWDRGLRYDERPWPELPQGFSEDSFFSPAIMGMGYRWTRVSEPCVVSIAKVDLDDPYYERTHADRGILAWARERHAALHRDEAS